MYKGQELVNLAETKIGTRGAEAKKYCGLPSSANYCDAFVTWLFYKNDAKQYFCNGSKQTYCPTTINIIRNEMPMIPIYLALPGDVIFYDWEPNGNPNHIGIARNRVSDLEIDTVEGNTSMQKNGKTVATGVVANKTRTYYATVSGKKKIVIQGLFRPQFPVDKSEYDTSKPLAIDGLFGFNSIACLQKALKNKNNGYYTGEIDAILGLNTIKALQKAAGTEADGSWGPNTTKAIQKMIGAKVDGFFGPASTKKLQEWINKQNNVSAPKPTPKPAEIAKPKTKAQQINDTAIKFAWPVGTPESKYRKNGGSPDPDFVAAWKKYFPKRKINTGCHSFVMLVLKACGYPTMPLTWSKILKYLREHFNEIKVDFTQAQLKPGDIRVHKNAHGGHHIWIIVKENGKYYRAEANQGTDNDRYAHINTHNGGNLKKHKQDWLFRAK